MRLERGEPPRKFVVRILIGLVLISQGAALIGDLALAGFVDSRPAWLIALNPRNRNLALATNQLDAVTYYGIGFARLVASDPVYYLLGFWYGDRALAWVRRRSRTYGPLVDEGERFFRRASYPLIFAAPNNVVCALSAATGVKLRTFIILNLSGTVARLIVVRQLGEVFESPIQAVIDFIAEYRLPVLIVSAVLVAWTLYSEFRGGDDSEFATLTGLVRDDDDEDDDDDDDVEAGGVGHDDSGDAAGVNGSGAADPRVPSVDGVGEGATEAAAIDPGPGDDPVD